MTCATRTGPGKIWLIMKISLLLIAIGTMTVSASSFSQNKKISLQADDINIIELLEEIREKSDYSYFLSDANVRNLDHISVNKKDTPVKEILEDVFEYTDYTYTMAGDVIIVKRKSVEEQGTQQEIRKKVRVKGVVKDSETGETLIGVNINITNSILGAITDVNGEFDFVLPYLQDGMKLVFSYVGFENMEVPIDPEKEMYKIQMLSVITELDDVVVTGYQVIDKRVLTSSIASVEAEELDMIGSLSVDQMLEGKATGLMITNQSSTPGAAAKVRIRGGSTFTGNQSPLWVIDGVIYEDPVPLSADEINSFDNINLIGNALTGINPQDIAKIDVLKDASATAIYGTRAANGVIVITTKRGKEGKPSLSYSGGLSVVRAPQYSDFNLMNSKERIDVSREIYENNLGFSSSYDNVDRIGYEGALMNHWDGTYNFEQFQNQVSYLETLNADWFGELYRPAVKQQHSLNASGGSKNARYYFSLGYDDQQGTEKKC